MALVESGAVVVRPGKPASRRRRPWTRRAYKAIVGAVAVTFAALVRLLPPRLAARIGAAVGILGFHLAGTARRVALESLGIAFPDRPPHERRRIARASFATVGASALEWISASRRPAHVDRAVSVEGLEHLEAARARGNGVLWITAHAGCWELMGAAIARRGFPCAVIATTVRYAAVNRWSIDARGRHGVRTVERDSPGSARELLRVFKRNELVGILLDHDTKVDSVQVDFFGRKAWTAVGPAELAIRLAVPAVTAFVERRPDGTHLVRIGPPIVPPEAVDDAARAARDLTQAYTARIEDHVRARPENWAWMHRRWT